MTDGTLPSIVVAGAMRCGTTTLHELLAAHPDVHASRVKEPHHFAWPHGTPPGVGPGDRAFLEQVVVDPARYRALWADGPPTRHRVESSAMYLHVEGTAARLAAAVPDVHVVVVLREPARRAWSNWVYQRMRAREPLEDFGAALQAEPERLAAGWLPIWAYREAGYYARRLRPWAATFGDRLHVLFLEELQADPAGTLAPLAAALDVVDDWPSLPAANPSGLPRHRWLQRLVQWRPPGAGRVLQALPEGLVDVVRRVRDRNVVAPPRPDEEQLARLREDYRANVDELEDLLGRPVPPAWRG